jgi:chaperonin cofactor prefoldin
MKRIVLILLSSVAAAPAADLPVREVVLYKHGVGFFERSGTIGPGETGRLDFSASEMNDVLKSLTITEKGGGKISGLRYDSMDPLSHKLADFPFRIGDAQPLAGMLDQLKGARVELKLGSEAVTGVIVNGRLVPASDKAAEREQLTLMLDSGDLRTVDLAAASGIRFSDANLQLQFKDYLSAVAAARSKDKRSVYIDSTDSKQREIVASYMVPAPVWKSSYRLILNAAGQPTLEGWAIVDNTTGEDWTKVALSLVSGRPISFVSQLYAPKYVTRPEAELADDAAARPGVHQGGIAGGALASVSGGRFVAEARKAAPAAPPPAAAAEPLAEMVQVTASSVAEAAAGRELGELFEYRIAQPVTIRKSESAMLPFLQQPVEARKLLIYSDHSSEHPTNAAELTNNSGKTLDGGPITVYDGGTYGGEALMETVKTGDKRLISYAVDLGTRITDAYDSKQAAVSEIHAARGVLTTKMAAQETRNYTIRNVDQKAKTLILEHPLRYGYTLLNQKPKEKTASVYRFEIALGAGATQQFAVQEERVFDQTYAVASLNPDVLLTYVRHRNLTDAGRQQLQRIADKKSDIAANDRELQQAASQISELTADETRIRQNIGSLNNVSGRQQQVQNYALQLDQHEQQLASLRDRQSELQKKKSALQAELDRLVEALSF